MGGRSVVLFLGMLALTMYVVWLLSADARQQLNKLATAPGDNLQWTLSQMEVEYGALRRAAELARADEPATLRELRQRFDILYSRVAIIENARAFAPVLQDPGVSEAMDRVVSFVDDFVPLIDSSDEVLAAGLTRLRERAEEIQSDVRMTSLVGVKVYSAISETNRELAASAMFDLAMLVMAMVLLLVGVVVVLFYLLAITRSQTDEIEQTRSRLGSIVGTSLDAVVVVDRRNRIVEYNAAAERIFGYTREEALGADMATMIIPPHMRGAHASGMRRHLETGATRMIDSGLLQLQAMRKGGEVFPIELSISTARSAEGKIYISFIRDISDRISAEKELVEARDRAVMGEKAKADLLAVMSHEMRTPLNGILGTLELLDETDLNERQRHFVGIMETSGKMLLRHVNDVLDVSRMDAETAKPVVAPFDPAALAEEVAESLKSQAVARGNAVSVDILGPLPKLVSSDRGRIEQILVNLVGNACKFTRNGRIAIEIDATEDSDLVEFRVIDTGVGIAEPDLARIFDDFVTLDTSYARSSDGTGLGLGIARRLVEVLGGEIGVESEPGEGSVFWFRLSLPPAQSRVAVEVDQSRPVAADICARRVLLVEDNDINRLVAREMLEGQGCIVTEAVDGIDGVAQANGNRFDLILMDISMPRLDGVTAATRIHADGGQNADTPVVALTAHALPEDIERFRAAGFADVLVKPLSRRRLAETLSGRFGSFSVPEEMAALEDDLEDALGGSAAARVRSKAAVEIQATLEHFVERLKAGATGGELAKDLHRLVGLAGLLGLADAHQCLLRLQDALTAPSDLDLGALVSDIMSLLDETRDVA